MEAFEAVRTVLAVRAFLDKPMPPEIVQRIIDAGRLTASAKNDQPWHFVVVDDRDELRKLGGLAKSGPYIAQAPLAIVVVIDRTPFAVSDGSRAIQSMILTAWSEGIASNWVGFVGMPEVNKLLNIPDNLDVLAVLPFGYPVKAVGQGKKKRKAISEVVYRGKFGQPYK
jgi:nitroreductase